MMSVSVLKQDISSVEIREDRKRERNYLKCGKGYNAAASPLKFLVTL